MSMPEDLAAIDRYMKETPGKTASAIRIKDDWTVWYDGIGWWGSYSQENYDHARNLRNQFNLANATTSEDLEMAQRVMQTGLTTEELAGGTRRTLSTGMYDEPLISSSTKLVVVAIGAFSAVIYIGAKLLELETLGPKLATKWLGKVSS